MRRPANMDWVHRTLQKMRAAMPDLALRTTFIVGYPGETEEEFQALLDFIKRFNSTISALSPSSLKQAPKVKPWATLFRRK
jgi:tRNA A37 methylthiotransferase MiaB